MSDPINASLVADRSTAVTNARGVKRVADVLISARNEESRIGTVISAALTCPDVGKVIAVVNGACDSTAAVARSYGVETIELLNADKGLAVLAALKLVEAETVCLLDSDLESVAPHHISSLIRPVLADELTMTCGILQSRRGLLTLRYSRLWLLSLTGQRACRASLLRELDPSRARGYKLEVALNSVAFRRRIAVKRVGLEGVQHVQRERKEFPTPVPVKWATILYCYIQYGYLLVSELPRLAVRGR